MAKLNFKTMNIQDIVDWCKANNEVDWLKAEAAKKVVTERYTQRKQKVDKDGNPILNKAGNPIWVVDKTSPKEKVSQPISFVQLKYDFCRQFMPDIIPVAKDKEPTMFEIIAAL